MQLDFKSESNMKTFNGQRQRILDALLKGKEIPAIDLHKIGSGNNNGFCASLSRRISEIRDEGYDVICRKENHDGKTHTFYTLIQQFKLEQ